MSSKRSLKIVVAGFAAGFPMGGQLWMMLHFMLGFTRLGHEVLFLEDTSDWAYPFDPLLGYHVQDSTNARHAVENFFSHFGLSDRYAYHSEIEKKLFGPSQAELDRFCAEADLFLNISGVIPLRENYLRAKVKAVIDTDPVFTQYKVARDPWMTDYYKAHDACFTFGCNLPSGKCGVPLGEVDWIALLPPVLLDLWQNANPPGLAYTTIGSWDAKGRDIELDGKHLSWRKSVKYERIIDLPAKLPGVTLDLTFSGMGEDAQRFAGHGWVVRDALEISRDLLGYRDYIQKSRAEFTMAKDQNVLLKSGWFSDRTATYLAAGRAAVNEDTGFGEYLPLGEGLFAFESEEEAIRAIKTIEADPGRCGQAAAKIAAEHFDAMKILPDMLKRLGLG